MPTYQNVSDEPINWVNTGHMEPGEVKIIADEIDHPFLKLVDDNEAVDTIQAVEPATVNTTTPTPAAPAAPVQPVQPPAPVVQDQPAPTPQPTINDEQGA